MATRTQSRIAVIQLLYAKELGNEKAIGDAKAFLDKSKIRNKQQDFAISLLNGVCEHEQIMLDVIDIFVKEWDIQRLGIVEKNILKLGSFELLETNTQKAVVINEAIEIAKMFNLKDACKLINAVLDGIANTNKNEIVKLIEAKHTATNQTNNLESIESTKLNNTKQDMRFKQTKRTKGNKHYGKAKRDSRLKQSKQNKKQVVKHEKIQIARMPQVKRFQKTHLQK